jgi:oxaloacetate decarboxylase alpha subunit
MTTAMMLPIAPIINEAGYKAIEFMGVVQFDACLRYLREDPWERIRLLHKAMPNTLLGAAFRSEGLTRFDIVPDSVVYLWIKRLAANGIRNLCIMDSFHDWDNIAEYVNVAKAEGLEMKIPLVFCESPVHTNEYYAQKTAELIKQLKPDEVYIKDPMGVITPERVRTLVPAIQKELQGLPLELHSHCTTGLAPLCYLEAMKLGVKTFHTAVSPLANGSSQPSIENIIKNARRLGFTPVINEKAVEAESAHFRYVAKREGKPLGAPVEYDVFQYLHQVPGGMITNLKFMLSQRKMEGRLDEVLEEIARIRIEWGYPIMVTPFSQIIGTQAVINVFSRERYSIAPQETIMYMLEFYGKAPAPINQNVKDKILSLPEAKDFLNWKPPQPSIEELRKEMGIPGISDDELLLRILFTQEHVDATLAAGPIKTSYPRGDKPIIALIQELKNRKNFTYINIQKGDFSLTVQNSTPNPHSQGDGV